MKKIVVVLMMVSMMISGVAYANDKPWKLIEDTYVVQEGDTIDSIADVFIKKNTYAARGHGEFVSGIRELNEELWHGEDVYVGEVLRINYWIKN